MYWASVGPKRIKLHSLGSFCGTYFYKFDTDSKPYQRLRNKHIHRLLQSVLIALPLMLISHAIVFITPISLFLFQHLHVTPLALHLPYFEKDSDTEFIANMTLQSILTFYALFGCTAIEISSCFMNHTITVIPDLFEYNLNEFRDELKANEMSARAVLLLRNAFRQIQDYNR